MASRNTRGSAARCRIAIIGAGVGGVAAAVKLKRAGFADFVVFEKSDAAGGTWHYNTYPGCECDIPSHFYSFSFMPYDWSRTHATQPEIERYINDTIDKFRIRDHFRFSTAVRELTWNEERSAYRVRTDKGAEEWFTAVISSVGLLSNPRYPEWPGMTDYEGVTFHTARWDHSVDLAGKRVAFVGTGSTAAQVVPAIAPEVGHLYVFQREPGWVIPKEERDYTAAERAKFRRSSFARKVERYRQYRVGGRLARSLWKAGSDLNREMRRTSLAFIEKEIQNPDVRAAVTPSYDYGCKRTIRASTFYNALNRCNVTLVPRAVERMSPASVIAGNCDYEVDVVIFGTGFLTQDYLATLEITGRLGRRLSDVWAGDARAFVGVTVPDFPNFFMLYGPNTNGGGSIIYQDEKAADLAVRMIKRIRRGAGSVDTRDFAYRRFVEWVDRKTNDRMSAQLQCNNYYFAASGRNVTQWPASHLAYHVATMVLPVFGIRSFRHRRSGPAHTASGHVASPGDLTA